MQKFEEVKVGRRKLKLWYSPEDDELDYAGYSISDSGGWLSGTYDSKESAIAGFKFLIKNGYDITDTLRDVNNYTKGNRAITLEDIKGVSDEI